VSIFECDVPANARMPAPHSHDAFDETVFGLDGVTTFTVSGAHTDLNPGEALFIPRRVIHGFTNACASPWRGSSGQPSEKAPSSERALFSSSLLWNSG
jgi:quercetin dioxygenase-like cupin family protein